jgi:phosphoglycerol transferase
MLKSLHQFHLRFRHTIRSTIRFLIYFFAFFLVALAYWVGDNFGRPPLEQVLYHLQFGMSGLVDTDAKLIESFVQICLVWPIGLALAIVIIDTAIALLLSQSHQHYWLARMAGKLNLTFIKGVYWVIGQRAPAYVLVAGIVYFCMQFSVLAFIHHQFGDDYFSAHYVYPKQVEIQAKAPKNLVLIYIESLENAYQDETLFGKNLLAKLDALGGERFEQFRQAPGTGWTIAGITATQCGLPLKSVSLYDGNGVGENIKSFLPRAVCLGDILHEFGYYNVYMGSDALAFSGKGKFFQDHQYDEIYGRDELKGNLTKQQMNYWGLYDDMLLKHAKAKLTQLHNSKKRYNFVLTTIDTHGPDGFYSSKCTQQGAHDFAGIVECTAGNVAELVQWMQKRGYLKNTQVVVMGDHLAMENPVSKKIDTIKQRHIYNQFISRQPIQKNRNEVLHFDMYPTIIEFLGFEVKGGRLGLGYSAISHQVQKPNDDYEEMEENLLNNSEQYLDLWKPKDLSKPNDESNHKHIQ